MTRREILLRRLEALLHHPPERSLTAGSDLEAKRDAAQHRATLLGASHVLQYESAIAAADRVGAQANEYNFPDQPEPGREAGVGTTDTGPFNWRSAPVLRHPLSGAEVKLDRLLALSLKDEPSDEVLYETVGGALEALLNSQAFDRLADDERERLSLALWRLLPERLAEGELGALWPLLPADPRIPDHSVWEHLSLTAALATAGLGPQKDSWPTDGSQPSTASLLLFTIGPVQNFVGAARKTRDLQAGSYLLAYLTWHAIRCVCEHYGPEAVLFPDLRSQPLVDRWLKEKKDLDLQLRDSDAATIPNRFFAVVPDSEAGCMAGVAEQAVRREFERIAAFALDKVQKRINGQWKCRVDWSGYQRQARDYFECYWTVLPFHRIHRQNGEPFKKAFFREYTGFLDWDDERANEILDAFEAHGQQPNVGAAYGRLYRLTEALTGSRKALRDFQPVEEVGYRCALIPSLSAIVPRAANTDTRSDEIRTPPPGDVGAFWEHLARRLPRAQLREGEQLSTVALAKRFLPEYGEKYGVPMPDGRFPSTGSFATADFKADVIAVLTGKEEVNGETEQERQDRENALTTSLNHFRKALEETGEQELNSLKDAARGLTEKSLPRLRHLVAGEVDDEAWKHFVEENDLAWLAVLDGGWLFANSYGASQIAKEYGFTAPDEDAPDEEKGIYRREDSGTAFHKDQVGAARDTLGAFLRAATRAGIDRPSKYYAVLQMDGDEMGKWLSGQNAPLFKDALHPDFEQAIREHHGDPEAEDYQDWLALIDSDCPRPLTPALHLAISRALGTFALDLVRRLVEDEHLGQLVYSGGDDVLAFVSFRDALPMARRLRAAFSGQVEEPDRAEAPDDTARTSDEPPERPLRIAWTATTGYVRLAGPDGERLRPTMGHTATASTGIVLAHYKQSLQQVVREAHEACETYAKDDLGRNALALAVLKRSGEHFRTGTKWHTTTATGKHRRVETDLTEALERFAELVRGGWIATSYVYDLEAETAGLSVFEDERRPDESGAIPPAHEAVIREAYRLFKRRTEALRHAERTVLPEWLVLFDSEKLPDWLKESTDDDTLRYAFAATVATLLTHNPLSRLVSLLDAVQFLGQGGDR